MGPQAVEALFNESDADGDGRLNDAEVRAFFSRTGLSEKEAAVILAMVKPGSITERQSKDLTRRRFSQALRLVALAQSGKALTPELAQAAMEPDTWTSQDLGSLPAPQIGPLGSAPTSALRQTPSGNPFRDSEGPEAALPAQFDGPAADLGAVFGPVGPPPVDDDDDIFNLASLKKVVPSAVPSAVAEPAAAIGPEVLGEGVGSDGAPVLEGGGVSRIAAGASRSGFARSKAMTHSPSELKGSKPSVSGENPPSIFCKGCEARMWSRSNFSDCMTVSQCTTDPCCQLDPRCSVC